MSIEHATPKPATLPEPTPDNPAGCPVWCVPEMHVSLGGGEHRHRTFGTRWQPERSSVVIDVHVIQTEETVNGRRIVEPPRLMLDLRDIESVMPTGAPVIVEVLLDGPGARLFRDILAAEMRQFDAIRERAAR